MRKDPEEKGVEASVADLDSEQGVGDQDVQMICIVLERNLDTLRIQFVKIIFFIWCSSPKYICASTLRHSSGTVVKRRVWDIMLVLTILVHCAKS